VLSLGVLLFLINIYISHRKGTQPAPLDPWDARSLEWITSSPPKEHNFDRLPTVGHLDEFFHRKYEDRGEGERHDYHQVATAEEILAAEEASADKHIHLPSPSYWPILLAFSLPIMGYGVIYNLYLLAGGALLALVSMYGWGMEPHTAPSDDYDPPKGTELEVAAHG